MDEGYYDVANAIVERAAKDYVTALRRGDHNKVVDLENFFKSNWCGLLTDINTKVLMENLKKWF